MSIINNKSNRLFLILGGFFIANAIMAEFIGVKIFSLEKLFGTDPVNWTIFGVDGLSFSLTCGVILWPVVFVLTDVINEYFGKKGVRFLSFLAVGLIAYAFMMVFAAINVPPADWWEGAAQQRGVENYDDAFGVVFGQGLRIILGSIVAFLIGQIVDVMVFHKLKEKTGEGKIWLRATGSTLVSQLIDNYVVLFIAFYGAEGWSVALILSVGVVNYIYKFVMAVVLTPAIYFMHWVIDNYLGEELANKLKREAAEGSRSLLGGKIGAE